MRDTYKKATLLATFLSCFACLQEPDIDFQIPEDSETSISITSDIGTAINAFKQSEKEIFTFDSEDHITVEAFVISSDEAGNFYKTLVVQDKAENPTHGLELKIDRRSYYSKYNFGRKLFLKLSGLSMQEENGKYIIGYLSGGSLVDIPESLLDQFIFRSLETVEIMPLKISLEEVSKSLINIFVALDQIQFLRQDLGKSFAAEAYDRYNGMRVVEQCDNLARSYLFTSTYANFRANLLPGEKFDICAVLSQDYYSREINMVLNYPTDLKLAQGERCDPLYFECPGGSDEEKKDIVFYENFDGLANTKDIDKIGWQNINKNFGNGRFRKRSTDENGFLQISAYNSNEYVMEVWLVSPVIELDNSINERLTFDLRATFEEGSLLTVWFSTDVTDDVSEANWHQLDIKIPVGSRDGSNKEFIGSNTVQLDCLEGNIRLAFKYLGADPGASTTYDLDNILILGDKSSN